MSAVLFGDDLEFYQRMLKASGYLTGTIDGDWGPDTEKAEKKFLADADKLKQKHGTFDDRTERNISGLHIKAQELARIFMKEAIAASPHSVRIISGTRSYAEQNELFKKGRFGNPPPKVTNARGGGSNHNFCIAWDIGLFNASGKYLTGATNAEQKAYRDIGKAVTLGKLEWGGNWTSFVDIPHYQVATGMQTSDVRALFEAGKAYI